MIEQKVLIADDNANILKLLNLTFTLRKKFKIITAVNGEEALKIAKNEKPDIIILDVLMPVMTGWEALKEIKKDPDIKNTPVIMLTALSDKNDVSKGYSIGAFDFITKPFNPNDLYNLVEKLLAKKKLKIEKEPDSDKIFSVIFIGADKKNDELLQNFFSNRHISIKGYLKVNASKYTFFDKLGIELIENIDKIPEIKELDFIIDSENNLSTSFKKKLADRSVKIISGSLRDFLCFLLRESNKQIKSRQEYAREVNLNLKNLNFLNNLYSRTSKALSTENFAHISSESLMEITKAQSSLFFLYDSSSSRFRKITNKNITGPESIVPDEILNKTSGNNIYPSLTTDTEKIKSILKVLRINTACKLIISIPLLAKKNYLGLLLLFNKKYENYDKNTIELLKTTALQLSAGLENIKLLELSKEKQKLVENLLSKVVTIQEDERQRISSDIHDSISQSLTGILIRLQIIEKIMHNDPDQCRNELILLKRLITENIKETKRIVHNLRPPVLDDLGLIVSVSNFIKVFSNERNINVSFKAGKKNIKLEKKYEIAIYRIIQETLNNIYKHSGAKKSEVSLNLKNNFVIIQISDDGCGFDPEIINKKISEGTSNGIYGIKQRVLTLNGECIFESKPGKGVRIFIKIPIEKNYERKN